MNRRGALLAARIAVEIKELGILVSRAEQGLEKARKTGDDYYLDGVALNLHGFYSGLERVLEKIALGIDGDIPSGANWHRELLDQMATEVPGSRPAVISVVLRELLEDYRGFRHVVRNVYTYHLNPDKLAGLVTGLPSVMTKIETDLSGFCQFLRNTDETI